MLACGSDAASGDEGKTDAGTGGATGSSDPTLQLTYSPMYSAFVEGGAHEAQLPVQLKDTSLRTKGAKFTSTDPSVAVVSDTADGALITVKKDGTTNIKVSLDGETGVAKLTVKKFTEDQWKAGQARYSKSDLAIMPANGAAITALALIDPNARNANGACNTCHTAQAKTLKIENTPTQIAGYSDDELITIFTMGKKPDGAVQKTMIPSFAWGMFHSWTVTDEEKQGLIAFLRTQTPKANPPMIDYGVMPCADAGAPTGGMPNLCDKDGNPIVIPGVGGRRDAGVPATPSTDAGATTGTTTTADAGATGDAG